MPTNVYIDEPVDDDGEIKGGEVLFVEVTDADGNVVADRPARLEEQNAALARLVAGEAVL